MLSCDEGGANGNCSRLRRLIRYDSQTKLSRSSPSALFNYSAAPKKKGPLARGVPFWFSYVPGLLRCRQQSCLFGQGSGLVGRLPREFSFVAAKVPIRGCLLVDRTPQVQAFDNPLGCQRE